MCVRERDFKTLFGFANTSFRNFVSKLLSEIVLISCHALCFGINIIQASGYKLKSDFSLFSDEFVYKSGIAWKNPMKPFGPSVALVEGF